MLINLNIFPHYIFGSNISRLKAKYLGQLATRLYIFLFVIILIILIIYTMSQSQSIRKDFSKPSFERYSKLIEIYGDQLKCSCSSISLIYNQFIQIYTKFHPICSSEFLSDEMLNHLSLNISKYDKRDYRRLNFISYSIFK